ncbi:ankyrin repeat protein SKIP35-like [Canna indica]|uniref:Ankyrin repeat protein SKIP35-like n=1 Tax=Canna indica TaxID=4628 RepID=A0AAQ3K0T7_9LILI|nr:ankyrin repeat protein SKIP35-like [Canna indica]
MDKSGVDRCFGDNNGVAGEKGEGSNVDFSSKAPLLTEDTLMALELSWGTKKARTRPSQSMHLSGVQQKDKSEQLKTLVQKERIELGLLFQRAVSSQDPKVAEQLIRSADLETLNDMLCIALDSIWFLTTQQELNCITNLMKKIVTNGANGFTRAALRTSFVASCVSTCQSEKMTFADAMDIMAVRLYEHFEEHYPNAHSHFKAKSRTNFQKFAEWALKCMEIHLYCQEDKGRTKFYSTIPEVKLQLSTFKSFLNLAGNFLTKENFNEAFDAALFPLTLFSSSFGPGWASGTSAMVIQGLLGVFVEGGANNVNEWFLEASRIGSTELVRILLELVQSKGLRVHMDIALGYASQYCKYETMKCLVEEGNAVSFTGPLMRAAERGCMPVVQWFINRGCTEMDLCLALAAAAASGHVGIATYLLPLIPQSFVATLSIDILKAACKKSCGSTDGVAFLLHRGFLGDAAATYALTDSIATSSDMRMDSDVKAFLMEHWSEAAFAEGLRCGQEHFVNVVRIMRRGGSPICLRDLPPTLVIAIAYLPLYRECECQVAEGQLLSQKMRGQLADAAYRVSGKLVDTNSDTRELMAILEHHLPAFFLQ